MTIKELEYTIKDTFPDLICRPIPGEKFYLKWFHKDYDQYALFYTSKEYGNIVYLYLPYKLVKRPKDYVKIMYGSRIKVPNSPVLRAGKNDELEPCGLSENRHFRLATLDVPTLKFYISDLKQQYERIINESN